MMISTNGSSTIGNNPSSSGKTISGSNNKYIGESNAKKIKNKYHSNLETIKEGNKTNNKIEPSQKLASTAFFPIGITSQLTPLIMKFFPSTFREKPLKELVIETFSDCDKTESVPTNNKRVNGKIFLNKKFNFIS